MQPPRPGSCAVTLLMALCACGLQDSRATTVTRTSVARPDGAQQIAASEGLQARLDAAAPGAVFALAAGVHSGPLVIRTPVTLWGPPEAIVKAGGDGTTIRVEARGVRLLGFTVDGSGGRFDLLDAAIHVGADDVLVEGISVHDALFGILVEKCSRVIVRGCEVRGSGAEAMGMRGDTIRLWETHDCRIERNVVHDGRDMVVWYSDGATLLGNLVYGGRYGTHFMYSKSDLVEGNSYLGNVVGVFVMYSHDIELRRNVITRCSGAAGIGIGLKESGGLVTVRNELLANTIGIFLDSSPLDPAEHNRVEGNEVRLCGTAISIHGSVARTRISGNAFRDNQCQVRVDGGSTAQSAAWEGNVWDDYQGYDLDGDGIGDLPYELRSLSGHLQSRFPELAFFHGTPTLGLVDVAGQVMPMFRPQTLLVDPHPALAFAKGGPDAR